MQKLFDDLRRQLSSFLEQRDDAFMVLRCTDADTAYLLKILEQIEDAGSPHSFWTFAHDFHTPEQYVAQTVKTVQTRLDALREQIAEDEEPLPMPPDLPSEVFSLHDPVLRLQRLMAYTRALADATEHCVAWALLPGHIADGSAYLRFVHALVQHDWPVPWFHHLRIFLREDRHHALVSQYLARSPRMRFQPLTFDPETLAQSLVDQAADAHQRPELRMQAYLMLAAIDYGHQRYPAAMEKYGILATYYRNTKNLPLLALSLNGIGEVLLRSGNAASAQAYFESALTPAIEAKEAGLAVLINISLNLGNLHLSRQDYGTAIAYFEGVAGLATATRNAHLKLQVRESQGSCHLALGQHREAWERWQEGVTLARALSDDVYQERLLLRLLALYEQLHMTDQMYRVREELRILRERGPEALQPLARRLALQGGLA